MNIDPLAEKRYKNNPYMYCNNNPIAFIDPNGMDFTVKGEEAKSLVATMQNAMNNSDSVAIDAYTGEVDADYGRIYPW